MAKNIQKATFYCYACERVFVSAFMKKIPKCPYCQKNTDVTKQENNMVK